MNARTPVRSAVPAMQNGRMSRAFILTQRMITPLRASAAQSTQPAPTSGSLLERTLFTDEDVPPEPARGALNQILRHYVDASPSFNRVVSKLWGSHWPHAPLRHDHFAFRTFGIDGLGIRSLSEALKHFGYHQAPGELVFPKKHLRAHWFAPPIHLSGRMPRIFVSELQVDKLSPEAQSIVYAHAVHCEPREPLFGWTCALTASLPWPRPSLADHATLLRESEYAAWVLANGYNLNHTALAVHSIPGFSGGMAEFADLLRGAGFALNEEGGAVKVSPDGLLLQCSTLADVAPFAFSDGVQAPVARAYVEFAERLPLPEFRHVPRERITEPMRRDGFEVGNADGIFESTRIAAAAKAAAAEGGSARSGGGPGAGGKPGA